MQFIILFYSFLIGSMLGSFLNVVVPRRSLRKSILGSSKCPKCKKKIHARDLIPILSYISLGGKCRSCGKRISSKYSIVEIFTAVVFSFGAFFVMNLDVFNVITVFEIFLFLTLTYLAVYDLWFEEIPLYPVLAALFFAIFCQVANIIINQDFSFYWIFAVIFPLIVIFCATKFYKRQVFGPGDYLILLAVTISLSAKEIYIALETSLIVGAVFGLLISFKQKKRLNKLFVPLVPFLVIGWILALNFGEEIWNHIFDF